MLIRFFRLIFILFLSLISNGQELPPIAQFTTSDYGGDNQNWMVSQDSNHFIYVANNKGLLEFNGSEWHIYPSPNNSILRAVKVINDVIYTGCYQEFGYWKRDAFGQLNYTSLVSKLKQMTLDDEQVWNILDYDEWVLFQSSHKLIFYHKTSREFKIISSESIIYKVFNVDNKIYYHVANKGIYAIEDGRPQLISNDAIVLLDRVVNIFKEKKELIIITRNSGFHLLQKDSLIPWNTPLNEDLEAFNIFSSIQLKHGSFIVGTISNGILKISSDAEIDYTINQKKGLANNTVLALFEDSQQNVWAGLDNGINCINVDSPIRTFIDYNGVLGTVYTTSIFKGTLYVGTNQGLFYRLLKSKHEDFKFIEGTAGQVWNLYNHNNQTLFCGHHLGTFLIDGHSATNISQVLGAWNFKKIPNRDNALLQGNYDGLYILQNTNGNWSVQNKIEGFKNSSRFFEINQAHQVLVNHEYKGVFRIQLNGKFTKADSVYMHNELSLGENSSLVSYRNEILYTSKDGVYKYEPENEVFKKDALLSKLSRENIYTSGKMIVDDTGKLWMFSQNDISYIDNDNLTNTPKITKLHIPSHLRQGVLGFENLQKIDNNTYIFGISNGYLIVDLEQIKTEQNYRLYLNSVELTNPESKKNRCSLDEILDLEHKEGILFFNYSVPEYDKYKDVKYQYRLEGHLDKWSSWVDKTSVQFENLSFGDYTFMARAMVGNTMTENIISYSFKVNRPWYISNLALFLYILMLIGVGFLVHKTYKFYYDKILKHEQMKNEKTIIQIKNEKLNQDIESKNRELAISTMSIIKKNELLSKIKKELKNSSTKEELNSAINLIDANLNNNKDWKFFKEAFNNADKGFLDKIKVAHPDLTPNDLKFCAYLRLNLSSKEIAPLLNISTKSVETKRYRLRKRLGLHHDESLVNYILNF